MSTINSKKIIVHTGNILENEELVRKVGQSTLEELRACVKTTLNNWKNEDHVEEGDTLFIRGVWNRSPFLETRDGLKTTVKVFLSKNSGDDVYDAVQTLLRELRLVNINTVIVVPPDVSDDLSLKELMPVWEALEASVNKNFITNIGTADLLPQLFMELYEWARVKPSVFQANVSNCCTVPEVLTKFAVSHDIQILTHNDDAEVIDEELTSTIMSRIGMTGSQCEVQWLARHRSIETCYGLVSAKGYTVSIITPN